jgi:hypothetical protein
MLRSEDLKFPKQCSATKEELLQELHGTEKRNLRVKYLLAILSLLKCS